MTIRLIHGNCLEVMPTLPANCVQMVFADLPYATPKRRMTDAVWDFPFPINDLWFRLGAILNYRAVSCFTATQPFASLLVTARIEWFRYDLIWDRLNPQGHFNANRAPLRRHEHVLIFSRKAAAYNPIMTAGKDYSRGIKDTPAKAFLKRQTAGKTERIAVTNKTTRYPTSIVQVARGANRGLHPTQKPVALVEWLIKTYTNEGDTVLDPTAGSGTTAIAAMRTNRRVICIEKDAKYYDIMCKRVEDERRQGNFKI